MSASDHAVPTAHHSCVPPAEVDVAIVGGGVAGLYCCLQLFEKYARAGSPEPVKTVALSARVRRGVLGLSGLRRGRSAAEVLTGPPFGVRKDDLRFRERRLGRTRRVAAAPIKPAP